MNGCACLVLGFAMTLLTGVWAPLGFVGLALVFIGWRKIIPAIARLVQEWEKSDD